MAQFKAYANFSIKGRGLILSGWSTEGTIKIGMSLRIPGFPRILVIRGFEHINSLGNPNVPKWGLFFPSTDPNEIKIWNSLDLKGKTFEVSYLQ